MLNERSKLILNLLLEKRKVNLEETAKLLGVTERTIRNDLAKIDGFLTENNLTNLKKETMINYSIENEQSTTIHRVLNKIHADSEKQIDYWEEPIYRLGFLYNKLFWSEQRITIESLEKELFVSRSTINNDLKKLKNMAKEMSIDILFEKNKGLYLLGKEEKLRILYFHFIDLFEQYNYDLEISNDDEAAILTYWIRKVEEELMIEISYSSFQRLIPIMKTITGRIQQGKKVTINSKNLNPKSSYEMDIIDNNCVILEKYFNIIIPPSEVVFISKQIYRSNLVKNEVVYQGYQVNLDIIVNTCIKEISKLLKIDLTLDKELFKHLALHFQTTITKDDYDIAHLITKETFKDIKAVHEQIYTVVKRVMQDIGRREHLPFNNEMEWLFITLHIVSSIEKIKDRIAEELNVILICHMGIGTSQFLKYQLNHYFKFKPRIVTKKILSEEANNADMIISTIHLQDFNISYIQVTPYVTEVDIKNIQRLENQIIEKKITFQEEGVWKGRSEPMLKDLLTEETIETKVHVNDWEEAIIYSGKILEKTGVITNEYTQEMVEAVKNFGPYIVIAPRIALAHASSKDGVHQIGMSLITLDEGVEFGNKDNDPVRIVICLAAIDHHTHLKALSELVEELNNEEFVNMLLHSDKEEIVKVINQK
ncbi:BglG family transcription antiterminator [Oceanobacillus oncorhynchi]|uniref:BglG family transcription antiterminator n=1 Tax=Oceanobacillus oncorhynchi TaxID=545501 RepID=UPI0025A311BA|nr:PTS sugar transporter subunit IIA [Oceanobacillus oncorhynchi]MDM8101354.1 PTS sugar transporter subunit IIA [Oceanobacillus oncorhynchi]